MTNAIKRQGPVQFPGAARTEAKNGFDVVLAYEGQGGGPWLADLSHIPKWDLQDRDIEKISVWGLPVPEKPGQCRLDSGRLVGRLNPTQALAWDLSCESGRIGDPRATDLTDGWCVLAVVGARAPDVMERITPLDVFAPDATPPALVQGPVLHVPCRLVRLPGPGQGAVVLIAFSRGYGQSMVEGILAAAADLGLRPGGEEAFTRAAGLRA